MSCKPLLEKGKPCSSSPHKLTREAFIRYLRKGTRPELSLKASSNQSSTTHYIWRTRGDNKVRPEHAANNGKIFAWDNPPPTGHPGEEFGCRCQAEAYYGTVDEALNRISDTAVEVLQYFRQQLANIPRWENKHMIAHFYIGSGRPVSLQEIGHYNAIKNYYTDRYLPRFLSQMQRSAILAKDGIFHNNFETTYDFEDILYSYRNCTVKGLFTGHIQRTTSGERIIQGTISVEFLDKFRAPGSALQIISMASDFLPFTDKIEESDISLLLQNLADVGGQAYEIQGSWETTYQAPLP